MEEEAPPKYLLQQPTALGTLALDEVAAWIVAQANNLKTLMSRLKYFPNYPSTAEDLLSRCITTIRNHLQDNMPKTYYNELATLLMIQLPELLKKNILCPNSFPLEYLLYTSDSDKNRVGRMIETVFTESLTSLFFHDPAQNSDNRRFDLKTWDFFRNSFWHKAPMLSGLVHLAIRTRSEEHSIINLLRELHHLKYLSLRDSVNDNVLSCIVDNCKLIEELNLGYNKHVNDSSIDILIQLRHLKLVKLHYTNTSHSGIKTLLLSCDNIEQIHIVNVNSLESAIEETAALEEYVEKRFNLIFYQDCHSTTLEQLRIVLRMCPRIQKIMLKKKSSWKNYLQPVKDLQELQDLTLSSFGFYADGVKELLQAKGKNLVHLHLHQVKEVDLNALMFIWQSCPNLRSLNIDDCFYQEMTSESETCPIKIAEIPLKYLKELKLKVIRSIPAFELFIFLLWNCPNAEFVDVFAPKKFGDNFMIPLIDEYKRFKYLKELKIFGDELSAFGIDVISQNCVNKPEVIAYSKMESSDESDLLNFWKLF